MNSLKLVVASLMLVMIPSEHEDQKAWELAKSGNGIEVFTRTKEGGKVKEFKAVTTVEASVKRAESLIADIDRYPSWQDNCEESHLVERVDDATVIARYTSKTPWPFSDRDIVLRMTRKNKPDGGVLFEIENAADAYPENDDYVRIPNAGGKWEITPLADNRCEVNYEFYADPAGNVPKWLVNMFVVQGPYNSFERMKEILN